MEVEIAPAKLAMVYERGFTSGSVEYADVTQAAADLLTQSRQRSGRKARPSALHADETACVQRIPSRSTTRRVLILRGQLDAPQVREDPLVRGLREAHGLKTPLEPPDVGQRGADDEKGAADVDVLGSSRNELRERDADRHIYSDVTRLRFARRLVGPRPH
jgi:hypothetical protein